jgi:acetylornithine deacetylase/succinyl-diaminopimelate desuccinylase-like protein
MKKFALLSLLLLVPGWTAALAQTYTPSNPAARAARVWRTQHEQAIMDEFFELLSLPNVSRDTKDVLRNADAIAKMMALRNLAPRQVSIPGANPVVFGEIRTPGATRTIVFYAHYDGQPLDPKEWASPPFSPVIRPSSRAPFNPESRIYARSAADDKAPIIALLAAIDGIRAAGLQLKSNVKFVFDGEEEAGSPNLGKILAANKELFSGDLWLICDGPLHQTRRQLVVFGARGTFGMDLTVYGPRNELHSGHYGNWAPNPAMTLARLLTSMKDDDGRVLVDGFYDGIAPLTESEKRALAEAPDIDDQLIREFCLWLTDCW